MAPPLSYSIDHWLEELRRMFVQSQSASENSPQGITEDESKAVQAARDARRLAKVAMQMAIGVLDVADEQQDEADRLLHRRLAWERVERAKEQRRLASEERQREIERARQDELDQMRRDMERLQQEEMEQGRILEEAKKEQQRQQQYAEHRAAQQGAAEAVKRAQAEAKRCREAGERARQEANRARERAERAEAAQRQQAAKNKSEQLSRDQQKASDAWARYTDQWELFKRFALATGATPAGGVFRFEDIPWPTLSPPTSPGMITKKQVEAFLLTPSNPGKTLKARTRECLLLWHPDKFSGRWMPLMLESDRGRVAEGVSAVTRAGNDILAEYASRRNSM